MTDISLVGIKSKDLYLSRDQVQFQFMFGSKKKKKKRPKLIKPLDEMGSTDTLKELLA